MEIAENNRPQIVVWGAASRTDVEFVRALARSGHMVVAAGTSRGAPSRWSRYTSKFIQSSAGVSPREMLMKIGQHDQGVVGKGQYPVLLPTQAEVIHWLAKHPEEWRTSFRALIPPLEALRAVFFEPTHERGPVRTVAALVSKDSEPIAACVSEALHRSRVAGVPYCAQITDRWSVIAPELVTMTFDWLKAKNWQGFAEVSWELGVSDSSNPRLLGVSGSPGPATTLGLRAGVDFASLYSMASRGDGMSPRVLSNRPGVRARRVFFNDLHRYVGALSSDRESIRDFFRGITRETEGWDGQDWRASLAGLFAPE